MKRVLLTTGIFFPDVGGPAIHVRKIAEHFAGLGWQVTVVAFGDSTDAPAGYRVVRVSRELGKLASWALYGWSVGREVLRHDVVYAFDLTTAGFPSALFSRMLRKPFILRIGGDSVWERVVEKGERLLPARAYYRQGLYKKDKPTLYRIARFVALSADPVVIPCDFLKELYVKYYGVREEKILEIKNPFPPKALPTLEKETFTFLFAGRFVAYKNLVRLLRVFKSLSAQHPRARLILVGGGPDEAALKARAAAFAVPITFIPKIGQEELFERINGASAALAPALTEFNPNFILESLALGKPALISRDNGLSVQLPEYMQFDPMDDASLRSAMECLLDAARYREALRVVAALKMEQTWDKVVAENARIVRGLAGAG